MFDGKKILIIMPFYYDYQLHIKESLIKRGAIVYLINEEFNELSFLHKSISIYAKGLYRSLLHKYYRRQFKKLPDDLDVILIIKGSTVSFMEFDYLRERYGKISIIMYQWDSVAHYPYAEIIAPYCDRCITFDPSDANEHDWQYRSLFFVPPPSEKNERKEYDITYVCSLHSERFEVLKKLLRVSELKSLKLFYYIYSNKWSFYRQKYLKKNSSFNIDSKYLKFTSLPVDAVTNIYNKSICIVDYKFPNQVGLTMRTIESIGYKCKLITNNKQIANEDFYDPRNILIYNLDNFNIPDDFLNSGYIDISDDLYYKYSINGWLDDVFNILTIK